MSRTDSNSNERTRQLFSLVRRLESGALDSLKPDKLAKHKAAQAFPKLALRDIDTAFSVVRDRGAGRPSVEK
jgi:hypothetical protein